MAVHRTPRAPGLALLALLALLVLLAPAAARAQATAPEVIRGRVETPTATPPRSGGSPLHMPRTPETGAFFFHYY